MKKNPYLTFPREFTTGKWRVHLVYPGEPRAGGDPSRKQEGKSPPAPTRWSSSTIPRITDSS